MDETLVAIFTPEKKDPALKRFKSALSLGPMKFIDAEGEAIVLPTSLQKALLYLVSILSRGGPVLVVPQVKYLSCNDAAKMLGCSRPHIYKLLDEKIIPYHYIGSHRRIYLGDITAYSESLDRNRQQHSVRMAKITKEIKEQKY